MVEEGASERFDEILNDIFLHFTFNRFLYPSIFAQIKFRNVDSTKNMLINFFFVLRYSFIFLMQHCRVYETGKANKK